MSSVNITVTPGQSWQPLYVGPTESPISVEKNAGTSSAFLAVSDDVPGIEYGHKIKNSELKAVELNDGETLYVKCVDATSQDEQNIFTVTD